MELLALLLSTLARPDLDAAVRLCGEGRYVAALRAAEAEPDATRRAQAVAWVRHHAGDVQGAFAVTRGAIADVPSDPWLLERAAYIAISLRLPREARDAVTLLEQEIASGRLAADDARRWRAQAQAHAVEVAALERLLAERDAAVQRARAVSAVAALVVCVVLGALAFRADRARPST